MSIYTPEVQEKLESFTHRNKSQVIGMVPLFPEDGKLYLRKEDGRLHYVLMAEENDYGVIRCAHTNKHVCNIFSNEWSCLRKHGRIMRGMGDKHFTAELAYTAKKELTTLRMS